MQQCPIGCSSACPNGKCTACLPGYDLIQNKCILKCGMGLFLKTDPNSSQQSCVSCMQNCDNCSDANSCDTCKNNFVYMKINNINECVPKCTLPAQYLDSQGSCQNCILNCSSCSQANSCDVCAPQYIKTQSNTCQCSGYFSNNQCLPCYSSCLTCSDGQSKNCQSCQNGYYPVLNSLNQTPFECLQVCPNNFQLVNNKCQICDTTNYKSCFNCPSTCRTCSSSQSTVCIDCFDGMQLNPDGKCSSLKDQRNFDFYFRSNNDIAVVNAIFSSQTPTLTLEFGINLISTVVLCNQIFDSSTSSLLGASSCSISTSQVIVSLSQDAKIMVTDTINIINTAKVLQFKDSQQPIMNIYLLSVSQEPAIGEVLLKYNQVVNYCNDVTFQIQTINKDAGRGFLNFKWVLDQIQNYDQSTIDNLNTIMQTANTQQQQTLVIPKQTFPPDINIAIKLSYTFKTNFSGQSSASSYVQSTKQIFVSAIQSLYPPLYRYADLEVKFIFFTQECGKSGSSSVQDIYDIQITSQLLPSLNQHFTQYKSQILELDIPPYSVLSANTNLDIQLQIYITKNQGLSTTYNLSIPYSLSNLQLFIQNGVDNSNNKRILNEINQINYNQFSTDSFRALAASVPQNILEQQINMTDQIGNLLNNITLPNQGQLSLQGNLISINTEQITAKNLQKYLFQNQPEQNDQNIYNVVLTNYTSNPYIQTDGFTQYTNQLQNQTPGIQISLNPVVKPFIQSINNGSNTTFDNTFLLQFQNIKPSKNNLTCLQQQSSQKWLNSQCKLVNYTTPGLCWYGKQLDSKQDVLSCSTIAPLSLAHISQIEQIGSQEKQLSPVKRRKRSLMQNKNQFTLNPQQEQNLKNDQNSQSQRWLKSSITQTGALQNVQLSNQQSQNNKQLMNNIQKQDLENENENQSILSLYVNQKQEKETEQINQQVKVDKESQDAKPSSIEIQTQQKIEENKKIVNKLKESKNTKKLQESSIFKKILIFHSFSSIFFVYSNQQSRAFRFSLFYLRVIHSMSISIIFDQQYNQEQILIISGINSVVIIVSAAIIQLLYKQRKIGKAIASLIMLGLLVLYYYIILSIVSGQSESYSNRKISSFFIMFGVDFLFFSTLISLFSIFIFNYIAGGGNSNGII
ncbi:hypothetical protein ABPG74_001958, partial [Tetrahymena malaccensis]